MIDLQGKVVLVTGASSGFGEEAAKMFAREGCRVVVAARRIDRLQLLVEEIHKQGGEALAVPVDVADRASIDVMVQSALDVYGKIDILFNNAGFGRLGWFENLDPDRDIEMQVDVNLLGAIQVARAVIPHMLARRSGHIINMASIAAFLAAPLYTLYSATKFGIRGFSDALRRDMAPFGIQVSVVCPGPAPTEFSSHSGDHALKKATLIRKLLPRTTLAEVARRVISVAKRPRRYVIFPWFYRFAATVQFFAPWLVDWFTIEFVTKRRHKLIPKG